VNCNAGEMSKVLALGTSTFRHFCKLYSYKTETDFRSSGFAISIKYGSAEPSYIQSSKDLQLSSEKGEDASTTERFRKMGTL
jgi:hypothetical protein